MILLLILGALLFLAVQQIYAVCDGRETMFTRGVLITAESTGIAMMALGLAVWFIDTYL